MDTAQLAVVVAVSAIDIGLGLLVLLRNTRSRTNRLFAAAALGLVAWLVANFLCDQPALYADALQMNRLTLGAGALMGVLLIAFVVRFPSTRAPVPIEWTIALAVTTFFGFAAVFTDALIADVEIRDWGTNVVQGWLFPYLSVWGIVLCGGLAVALVRRHRAARGRRRAQFLYLFLGMGSFFLASLVLGILVPVLTGENELAKLQPFATLPFLGFTAYAMVRHRLMDVRVIVLRGAAYTVLVAILGTFLLLSIVFARAPLAAALGLDEGTVFFLSALVAVVVFQPLRRALEGATDRVFYRRNYHPDRLLTALGAAMASTPELGDLASLLVRELRREMRLTFAALACANRDLSGMVSTDPSIAGADCQQLLDVCQGGSILFADDLEPDSEAGSTMGAYCVAVLVPLVVEDVVIGAMALGSKLSGETYSAQDAAFLEVLAPSAAIAVKNGQLFAEKNQRVRELTALNDLSGALQANLELHALLEVALDQVVAVTGADSGSVMLMDEASEVLTIAAGHKIPVDVIAGSKIRVGEGIAGKVAETRETITVGDDAEPELAQEMRRDKASSVICTPVIRRGEVIGVLSVTRKRGSKAFARGDSNVVTSFAGQLAVAVENARLFGDLAALVAASPLPIMRVDPKGVVQTWNPAATRLFGWSEEEAVGHFMPFAAMDALDEYRASLDRVFEARSCSEFEAVGVRRDGSPLRIKVFLRPLYDASGKPRGLVGIVDDITQRKRIEQAKDDFLSMVSHELRTPLAVVLGHVELLSRLDPVTDTERFKRSLDRVTERGQAMTRLVKDILTIVQFHTGHLELMFEAVDLESLVQNSIPSLASIGGERCVLKVVGAVAPVHGDRVRLGQAVENLCCNALKFSPEGTPVELTLRQSARWTAVEVRDWGVGIDPGDIERVFDRFTQADMSMTRSFGGVGMGLHIVRMIAEAHGGTVEASSVPGEGSTFTLRVPTHMEASGRIQNGVAGRERTPGGPAT